MHTPKQRPTSSRQLVEGGLRRLINVVVTCEDLDGDERAEAMRKINALSAILAAAPRPHHDGRRSSSTVSMLSGSLSPYRPHRERRPSSSVSISHTTTIPTQEPKPREVVCSMWAQFCQEVPGHDEESIAAADFATLKRLMGQTQLVRRNIVAASYVEIMWRYLQTKKEGAPRENKDVNSPSPRNTDHDCARLVRSPSCSSRGTSMASLSRGGARGASPVNCSLNTPWKHRLFEACDDSRMPSSELRRRYSGLITPRQ